MAPFLPLRALNRSSAVRINKQTVLPGVTTYVDLGAAGVAKEIAYHSAIGQVIVVGPIVANNQDWVVFTGGTVTPGAGVTVNTAAGELTQNSTGLFIPGVAGTNTALTLTTSAGQSQVFLVTWNDTTGAVAVTAGTPATTGTQVAPATPAGVTALAQVTLANGAASVVQGNILDVRPRT